MNYGEKTGNNILLIEDDDVILKVHKLYLERIGLLVDTARNGEEAFNKFQDHNYLLVILDGGLPDTTGKELGIKIRDHEKKVGRPRTPLILLSGFTEDLIEKWCLEADIDSYAIKPVHYTILEKLISHHLNF